MTPDIEAVIFDCDGTLVDSEPPGFAGILAAAREIGIEFASAQALLHLKGKRMRETLQTLEQAHGRPLPEGFESTLRRHMTEQFERHLKAMPGALALLQGLALPWCVASNGPREKMELTLSITGLLPWCAGRLISAYEVGSFKPDPGLFLHAARALGVAVSRCAVVEDSATGVEAALAAGMPVFVLRSPDPLPRALAARVTWLDTLSQLPPLLLQPRS